MQIQEIKTNLNSFQLYSLFKDEPFSFILDSGMDHGKLGKFSFIGFRPFASFQSEGGIITVRRNEKTSVFEGAPLDELRKLLAEYSMAYQTALPFAGGAVGYFGYDFNRPADGRTVRPPDDVRIPDCFMGLYDGILAVDHSRGKVFAAALGIQADEETVLEDLRQRIAAAKTSSPDRPTGSGGSAAELKANMSREEYDKAIRRIKQSIADGDVYQVNFTQRFQCALEESPFEVYCRLRQINPAPFACMLDFGQGHILCSSPERLLRISGRTAETRPIKGTCPRGQTAAEDQNNLAALLASEKDRAELLMIVDLERNDLGKVSKPGTVRVPEIFHPETYPTVHHLTATVSGDLRDEVDALDCLAAIFPGGSITGAPKIRAMEIIDELEPTARGVYTGAIGYIGWNGDADLNIAIRTILCKDRKAYFQAGGGIVWDSDEDAEYQESLDKAKALKEALRGWS